MAELVLVVLMGGGMALCFWAVWAAATDFGRFQLTPRDEAATRCAEHEWALDVQITEDDVRMGQASN